MVALWSIVEKRSAQKTIEGAPQQVKQKYEAWKRVVTFAGPTGLRDVKGFHDEALAGKWKGYRSSRLNNQYRVIYRTDASDMVIMVKRVTAHDYRR
jgi:addiction module RelE/StbE family toxin